jgi:hypothetical protein
MFKVIRWEWELKMEDRLFGFFKSTPLIAADRERTGMIPVESEGNRLCWKVPVCTAQVG